MFNKLVWSGSRQLMKTAGCRNFVPAFGFASDLQAVDKLRSAVNSEIEYEESNVEDLSEFKNFFENQGWKINERGVQVELEKNQGPYSLRLLFNAKTPMSAEENPDEQQGEEDMQEPDYTDLAIYIKKQGASKWLCCEFMVSNNNEAHLGLATFIKDYEHDRNERQKGRVGISGYTGPELSSLDENFQNGL